MPVYSSKEQVTLKVVREILNEAKKRFPVMHLSPFDKIQNGEGYVMSKQIDGTYSFKPNITRQGVLFRGDSKPLERVHKSKDDIQYQTKFRNLIESFPLYQMFKIGVKLPDGRLIRFENPYALAYIYGIPMPFIGLTSDLDVATFFAVTDWNDNEQKFVPIYEGEGILCSYELRQPLNQMRSLTTLSLQVFKRTFKQKSYVLQVYDETDFYMLHAVTGFQFTHNKDVTDEIFEKYKGGEVLAPSNDFLWRKWKEVRNTDNVVSIFTRKDLEIIYSSILDYWKEFVNLIDFGGNDMEVKNFLLELPKVEPYARYFDLNRCQDER